jgi:hypothetical protein
MLEESGHGHVQHVGQWFWIDPDTKNGYREQTKHQNFTAANV